MDRFTLDDLRQIMLEWAGQAEDVDLDGDILDVTFENLGYDSLAMLETTSRIEKAAGIKIPDYTVNELSTPRTLLHFVNDSVSHRLSE
jgi:act minimal PKS acyl carrier protein